LEPSGFLLLSCLGSRLPVYLLLRYTRINEEILRNNKQKTNSFAILADIGDIFANCGFCDFCDFEVP
jgi:hypothetical protein